MKKIKEGEIVKLIWLDAFGRGSWNNINDVEQGIKNHITCEIVGYYIKEAKNSWALKNWEESRKIKKIFDQATNYLRGIVNP